MSEEIINDDKLIEWGAYPEPKSVGDVIQLSDSEKMVVVTGDPRSGTSLMMQSLKIANLPITGARFPATRTGKINDSLIKHAIKLNPRGFYEIPNIVINGVSQPTENLMGKIVKIISTGIPNTNTNLVSKYILCLREPKKIVESQKKLSTGIEVFGDNDWKIFETSENLTRYIMGMGRMLLWFLEQDQETREKFVVFENENIIQQPEVEYVRLLSELGVNPDNEKIKAMVQNIDSGLVRSTHISEWPENLQNDGKVADLIYQAWKGLDEQKMSDIKESIIACLIEKQKENVMFFDDVYWGWISPTFLRQLRNDSELHQKTLDNAEKLIQRGRTSVSCKYFSRSDEKYVVKLPNDVGDREYYRVSCERDNDSKVLGDCHSCWVNGIQITINGEPTFLPSEYEKQMG